jgi:hypothetical protein
MPNRKFYVEFNSNERLERQSIRNWANENRNLFPNYTFEDRKSNFPITHVISKLLQTSYGFQEIEQNLEVILRHPNANFRF